MSKTKPITEDGIVLIGGISRSGTTLLTAILDAHPMIACGAELIPPVLPPPSKLIAELERGMALAGGRFADTGRQLRRDGDRTLGLFFVRCHRAGVTHQEVIQTLEEAQEICPGGVVTFPERLLIAQRLSSHRARRTGARLYGFKLTSASIDQAAELLPNASFICIVREPRDVAGSQIRQGFDRSVKQIAKAWNTYSSRYATFAEAHPRRAVLLRYEDLVRAPRRTLPKVFDLLSLELDPSVFDFYRSDSRILDSHHPNTSRLRKNFATDSIGTARQHLTADQNRLIKRACAPMASVLGYDNPGLLTRTSVRRDSLIALSLREIAQKRVGFQRRRNYRIEDYEDLIDRYRGTHDLMRMCDYVREDTLGDRKVLMLRHDIDHDLENAVKLAEWEHANGLSATYCLLHTAWYWGSLEDGRYRHTRFLIDGIQRLCELGHEVNLHNNLVALALREDVDPAALLEDELAFFDRLGVPVTGTSTHGDALCRELSFRNWELFKECCDQRFGGPRVVEHIGPDGRMRRVALGERSMFEFGLEYEAYDYARDVYHTDSGGNLRVRTDAPGRRAFGRHDPSSGHVVTILTHCLWWKI